MADAAPVDVVVSDLAATVVVTVVRGRGRRRGLVVVANKNEEKEWQPVTKLGRLVKAGKIKSMEEIYLHSLPIKEYQIVDFFLPKLKDEVMKVRLDHWWNRTRNENWRMRTIGNEEEPVESSESDSETMTR